MDASAVAEYLKQNPAFFEDYADVVAEIFVPHPHGGHAIPIAERQMLALRDKVYDLEQKLRELIRHGAENDLIGEKLIEVNVTSPTCFQEITEQSGFNVAGMFLDALERKASS